jgi:hypothetical protein
LLLRNNTVSSCDLVNGYNAGIRRQTVPPSAARERYGDGNDAEARVRQCGSDVLNLEARTMRCDE